MGIFGSYARSEESEKSDIDLLVEFQQTIGLISFVKLKLELSDLFKCKVDLVTKKALKPRMKKAVLREVKWIEGL